MITSTILSPSDCTWQALADFENLVIEAGTVDPNGLTERIRDAFRLLFLREANGQLAGVGALKRPLSSYRAKVFEKAGIGDLSHRYSLELGWVAVAKPQEGRGLSRRIIGELIAAAGNENLFATTREDARSMRFAVDYGFEPAGKPYRSGKGYDLVVYLRTAGQASA